MKVSPPPRIIQEFTKEWRDWLFYLYKRVAPGPLFLESYTVATVPDAALWEGAIIYVSDETGGATLAFSDGTNWLRVQDRATVS